MANSMRADLPITARMAEVMALRESGMTFQAIGDRLGFNNRRAHDLWKAGMVRTGRMPAMRHAPTLAERMEMSIAEGASARQRTDMLARRVLELERAESRLRAEVLDLERRMSILQAEARPVPIARPSPSVVTHRRRCDVGMGGRRERQALSGAST